MTTESEPMLLARLLFQPLATCEDLARHEISASKIFFGIAVWIGLIPPVFAFIGATMFGWQIGAVEPIYLPAPILLGISIAYYVTLLFGFVTTALVSQWMSTTYGASDSLGTHFANVADQRYASISGANTWEFNGSIDGVMSFQLSRLWNTDITAVCFYRVNDSYPLPVTVILRSLSIPSSIL